MKNNVQPGIQQQLYQEAETDSLAQDQSRSPQNSPRVRLRSSNLLLFRHPSPTTYLLEYGCSGVKMSHYRHLFTSEASSPSSTSDTASKGPEMKIEREGSKLHWWENRRRSSGLGTKHGSDGSAIHWSSSPQNAPTIKETPTREQKEPPKSKHKEREKMFTALALGNQMQIITLFRHLSRKPFHLSHTPQSPTHHNLAIQAARSVYQTPLPAPVPLRKPLCMQRKFSVYQPLCEFNITAKSYSK